MVPRSSRTRLASCIPRPTDTKIQAYYHHDQETIEYLEKVMSDDTILQV
jgi:hypothetical protein